MAAQPCMAPAMLRQCGRPPAQTELNNNNRWQDGCCCCRVIFLKGCIEPESGEGGIAAACAHLACTGCWLHLSVPALLPAPPAAVGAADCWTFGATAARHCAGLVVHTGRSLMELPAPGGGRPVSCSTRAAAPGGGQAAVGHQHPAALNPKSGSGGNVLSMSLVQFVLLPKTPKPHYLKHENVKENEKPVKICIYF